VDTREENGNAAVIAVANCLRRRTLGLLFVLLAVSLLAAAPALAVSQRGHVFAFAFGAAGKGAGHFSAPDGIAVNSATGDVYVADRDNSEVEEFEPVVEGGALVEERYVREFAVPDASSVAVDSSSESSDPSAGDVYVVGAATSKAIYKFKANGEKVGAPFKHYESTELARIDGLAVDAGGDLFVYQESGVIDTFSDDEANAPVSTLRAGFAEGTKGQPGFALGSEDDDFYADAESRSEEDEERAQEEERSSPLATTAKLAAGTGAVLVDQLDGEDATGVAVNTLDVEANDELDDVYVDNVTLSPNQDHTTIAQFSPGGSLIQRFGAAGLQDGDAIAVEPHSGDVYVADAVSAEVFVFTLEPPGRPRWWKACLRRPCRRANRKPESSSRA
jgi:hypothetical protein